MKKITMALLALVLLLSLGLTACNQVEESATERVLTPQPPAEELHILPLQYDDAKDSADMKPAGDNSQFVNGVMVADLEENEFNVVTMMSIDWAYIEDLQRKQPFHQYVATKAWQATYPGGDVTIRTVQDSEMTSTLIAAVSGGESPDIIPANDSNYPLWPKRNLTDDMKNYAVNLDLYNPEIYSEDLMKLYEWEGTYPWAVINEAVSNYYIVYNKTKFDDVGETTPFEHWKNGTWTWSQFVKTAKAMTTEGSYGFTGWMLFPYAAPYAMATITDDGVAQLGIKDTKYIRYMTEVYNFYQKEGAGRLDWDLQNWATLLPMGTDAMVITNLSAYTRMMATVERKSLPADLRIAPLFIFDPTGETEPISPTSIWGYSISTAAKNPVGAAEYIRMETLVMKAVNALEIDPLLTYLNEEELAMMNDYEKNVKTVMDPIKGIGDCYSIIDEQLVPSIYYGITESDVQALFDSIEPILQAELDDFNNSTN